MNADLYVSSFINYILIYCFLANLFRSNYNFKIAVTILTVFFVFNIFVIYLIDLFENIYIFIILLFIYLFFYIHIIVMLKNLSNTTLNYFLIIIICHLMILFCFFIVSIIFRQNLDFNYIIYIIMIAMSLGLLSILVLDCLNNKKKTDFLTQQIKSQQKQIRKYQKEYFELRKFKHDYNNNINFINNMFNLGYYDKLQDYIKSYQTGFYKVENITFCDNIVVDALLFEKKEYAENNGIKIEYSIIKQLDVKIDDVDLCSVIFNLIDNAVEACIREKVDFIIFKMYKKHGYLIIMTENECSCFSETTMKNNKKSHGIGMKIIDNIAKKYNGNNFCDFSDGKFVHIVSLLLE